MAFDITASARNVQAGLKAFEPTAFFSVEIARPGMPPGEGPSATIAGESMRVAELTLQSAIEVHVLKVTLWRARFTAGEEANELEAMTLASRVMDYFYQNFQLAGGIRAVDVGGIYGNGLEVSFEHRNLDETLAPYHIADITLPLIVDSATAFAA